MLYLIWKKYFYFIISTPIYNYLLLFIFPFKKYGEAIECYNRVIEINPKYLDAYSAKAIALDKSKKRIWN